MCEKYAQLSSAHTPVMDNEQLSYKMSINNLSAAWALLSVEAHRTPAMAGCIYRY